MEKKVLGLNFIWKIRLQLRAEGAKLRAESDKLWAESHKLRAKGDKLWAEAIIEMYGDIKIKWVNYNSKTQDYDCELETGEIFKS